MNNLWCQNTTADISCHAWLTLVKWLVKYYSFSWARLGSPVLSGNYKLLNHELVSIDLCNDIEQLVLIALNKWVKFLKY